MRSSPSSKPTLERNNCRIFIWQNAVCLQHAINAENIMATPANASTMKGYYGSDTLPKTPKQLPTWEWVTGKRGFARFEFKMRFGQIYYIATPHECYMSNRRARWAKLVRWLIIHDDVMKWKHFPRYWPLCGEFTCHRLIPLTKASDAKLWYSLICAWTNGWVNKRYADYLRRHRAHYDVTIMVM